MLKEIYIKNFKSIYELKCNPSRLNLFIGENGSGKSNLLEALVFVSAAQSNKLDNEFLTSRGIRVTDPSLMRSAFNENEEDIEINLIDDDKIEKKYRFINSNEEYSEWIELNSYKISRALEKLIKEAFTEEIKNELISEDKLKLIVDTELKKLKSNQFKNFIIYSPENTALRMFEKEGQILPLGINGEGLLKLLKVVNNYEDKTYMIDIISSLKLFNWFDDIIIPTETIKNNLSIKDKYLYKSFTQHSANEGFLFILFYITLIVAKETPTAFAIDNIDASLNPKLCTKLMTILSELSKKYNKQIFLTTHNPAILDGIDLSDENQRLFVVSRNKKGYTRLKHIDVSNKPKSSTDEPLKLSEAFLRGYLGGLPKGF